MSDKKLTFRALQLANEQRNAYGLRYNDYARYRKHCANRTHRLRSTLKMTHGKGRDFKKLPPLVSDNMKEGHLELLLCEAERAWAYGQELFTSSLQPANADKASTLRHSAAGRFRRALHWSTQLLSHCQTLYAADRLSADAMVQASVYTLVLNGRTLRYREQFDDALVQLAVARSLLDELVATASTSRDQALATLFSDSIGPEIRYCAHELGREKSYDVDAIVAELGVQNRNEYVEGCSAVLQKLKLEAEASGAHNNRYKLKEPEWEGEPVPIRNPELVDALLKVQDAETRLAASKKGSSKKNVAAYDHVLAALSDAEELARKLSEAQQLRGASTSTSTPDMQFVHDYILFQLLSRRIHRDVLLLSSLLASDRTSKSKDPSPPIDGRLYPAVVKMLDTIVQSLTQMRTLSIVDDSPGVAAVVDAKLSYSKARRCLYLSRCYAPLKKYAEALSLLQHANIHIREARQQLADPEAASSTSVDLPPDDLDALDAALAKDALKYKRDWYAYNGGSLNLSAHKTHKKPVFFDIAMNYVPYDVEKMYARAGKEPPVREEVPAAETTTKSKEQIEERPQTPVEGHEQASAPQRGGLSSLLGGWWGRS
ncbi:hypothetical protein BD626DRAFT_569492 [Schizophyllum amplum]|uniref:Signal recognition particle subunit SRP68 n=1 Tax=Schizophyllum amplum TaxID=97359 RepID=A0A550CDM5_9AGAR|nr:hypothetical protein BD626DRAFT_569492 [Auriculariopsis ampla]